MPVTDSPRLLTIEERPEADEPPPAEPPAEEQPAESPAEEQPAESPAEEQPAESPAEEQPAEPPPAKPVPAKPPRPALTRGAAATTPVAVGGDSTVLPRVTVSSRGARKLFETGHMTVVAHCDRPCEVVFGGHVHAAGRGFELDPRQDGSVPAGPDLRGATAVSLTPGAVRHANRALAQGRTVRIRLVATAVGDAGSGSDSQGIRLRGKSSPAYATRFARARRAPGRLVAGRRQRIRLV